VKLIFLRKKERKIALFSVKAYSLEEFLQQPLVKMVTINTIRMRTKATTKSSTVPATSSLSSNAKITPRTKNNTALKNPSAISYKRQQRVVQMQRLLSLSELLIGQYIFSPPRFM
jgi:hypothetical protein